MKYIKLIVSILIPLSIGYIGSLVTTPAIDTWYTSLNKSIIIPPNWVFAPVWTILFILIGIAFFIAWEHDFKPNKQKALSIYAGQLGLNFLWSFLFFGLQNPTYALIEIMLLLILIIINIKVFFKVSPIAGYLLIPYALWVTFAMFLNLSVVILN